MFEVAGGLLLIGLVASLLDFESKHAPEASKPGDNPVEGSLFSFGMGFVALIMLVCVGLVLIG